MLRRTTGVVFDEMVPSDIPKMGNIDKVIHSPNSISPGPVEDSLPPCKRPWYMHPGQDDNLLVLQRLVILIFFVLHEKKRHLYCNSIKFIKTINYITTVLL